MGVNKFINQFLEGNGKNKGKKPEERYSSFDYCYNYFYSFHDQKKISKLADEDNIELSCLHLGFYLASWGMLRGSSFLLEKSLKHYENLINSISSMDSKIWEIDIDNYNSDNVELIMNCKNEIIDALGPENAKTWDTLTSKIMLGVFGNVPAFDKYFQDGMKLHSFNEKSLNEVNQFYMDNKDDFDSFKIYTFDFKSSNESDIIYTKAKLVDMYAFMKGQSLQ